jgi:hypothetical protein
MKLCTALIVAAVVPLVSIAQLPLVQTRFTADPAPVVIRDTVFLYTTHDEDGARGFEMLDWLLYTSTDMVNWTDQGTVASLKSFKWIDKKNGAWANQVVERNGKYYMYCPIHGNGIGVLVADSPYGPFKDPLGKALVWQKEHWNDIDPTVFIDDDGQAWMFWGNPDLYYVKLNEDMISVSGEIVKEPTKPANYQEGPWVYKRGRHYYLAYASTCCPEGIGYAMSDSPTGPWEYKGMIMEATQRTRGNHPGIIDYRGKSYVFGLSYDLHKMKTPEFGEQRSSMASEMSYNLDGTIPTVPYWKEAGVKQIETLDPFRLTQAETIGWSEGVKTQRSKEVGMYVTQIQNNDYIILRGVDFRQGASSFEIEAASDSKGGQIEIRVGDFYGPRIGVCEIGSTGGWDKWKTFTTSIDTQGNSGVQDLYFIFKGSEDNLFNLNSWQFKQ